MSDHIPNVTLMEFLNDLSYSIGPIPEWIWYTILLALALAVVRAVYPWFR